MVSILDISGSITPWVLSFFVLALLIAFGLTFKSWREARRSPYFFQRREALQQMQSYALATMAILIASASVAAYAYSPSLTTQPRVKVIAYAKPQLTQQETAREAIRERLVEVQQDDAVASAEAAITEAAEEDVAVVDSAETPEVAAVEEASTDEVAAVEEEAEPIVELIEEAEEVAAVEEAVVEEAVEEVVSADADISTIQFATNIDQDYNPVGAGIEFSEGNYKIYATFNYSNVPSGTDWKWVWKHNGVVVGQESAQWTHGESGPGWVFFSPESGFAAGTYSLEMWLDGAVVSQSNMNVSTSVANQ